jgi:ATP-dependent Clp protease protease subunit
MRVFSFTSPRAVFRGQASDIEHRAEDIIKIKRRMIRLYANHCGRSDEEVERTLDRDFLMTAEEAKAWALSISMREPRRR